MTYRLCPYCGEAVWRPVWRRVSCAACLVLPPVLAGVLAWTARPAWAGFARLGPWAGFLLACGVAWAAAPCGDADRIATSRRELRGWQAEAVCGSVLMGVFAAWASASLRAARSPGWAAWAAAALLGFCVLAAPFLFRIPRRAWAAAALIVAGFALG